MIYKRISNKLIIRIDRGEEIVDSLKKICMDCNIKLGIVSGIGAASEATIGIYFPETQKYQTKVIKGNTEITNLTGNVTTMNNEIYLHLHINISDENYNVWGGHLNKAIVGGTCEVFIDIIESEIDRKKDNNIGLNLISFN